MMRAMVLMQGGQALRLQERAVPEPAGTESRLRVQACAVCRTDLRIVDGELDAESKASEALSMLSP